MSTELHLSTVIFSVGSFIFLISILHNMIAARFVEAPNNSFNVSTIATLLTFSSLVVLVFILKFLNALFYNSYHSLFILFALTINVLIFSFIFNVDLIKGCAIVLIGSFMTAIIVSFCTLVVLYFMGFSSHQEVMKVAEPYLFDLLRMVGYNEF